MISAEVYKIVHLVGVMMVFLSLGGVATNAINGGLKNHLWRKPIAITHGLGLVLSLVGGFGLLARLGIVQGGLPGWVWVKLGIWIMFAILIGVVSRKPGWARSIWPLIIILGAMAAYLAGSKPF
ncbi:MAG: hypothetical protein IPK04_13855 [Bdellovibrionales bacterium]|jgi:hypothetical protein|nr:hypothetical protein [Bdellovibrionales bacterium]